MKILYAVPLSVDMNDVLRDAGVANRLLSYSLLRDAPSTMLADFQTVGSMPREKDMGTPRINYESKRYRRHARREVIARNVANQAEETYDEGQHD